VRDTFHPNSIVRPRRRRSAGGRRVVAVTRRLVSENWLSGAQLVEQSLGLFQIESVEAFGKPAVDRSE
jgi:hypothetical protein